MARATKFGLAGIAAGAGLMVMAGAANAADLDFAPPPTALGYDWSGFYIGGAVGGMWGKTKNYADLEIYDTIDEIAYYDTQHEHLKPGGWMLGGYAGYNWQVPSSGFVFGLDADIYGAGASDSKKVGSYSYEYDDGEPMTISGNIRGKQKIESTWAVRGRAGWAIESFMAYLAGGYAGASMKTTLSDSNPIGLPSASRKHTYTGWTIGGGIDFLVTPNWVMGVDYQYKDLGKKNMAFYAELPDYDVDIGVRSKLTTNQVTLRGSFKF